VIVKYLSTLELWYNVDVLSCDSILFIWAHNMEDWKLKARTTVKLKKERNMFVSLYIYFLLFYDFVAVTSYFGFLLG